MRKLRVLIVGGGHGGANAAVALRRAGFAGSVAIVTDDLSPPYERPALSKEYLAGERTFERMLLRPEAYWREQGVDLLLGSRVSAVEPEKHEVILQSGEVLAYGSLLWAAGGEPRRLTCPGHDLRGVHTVRTRADVDRMTTELPAVESVAVIGGGYIGLEVGAVLTKLGKKVTILEAQRRLLARVAGEPVSSFFEAEHRAHGVDVKLGVTVDCILESGGRAVGVRLAGGEDVPAQMVVVGIGIRPCVAPLLEAGATGGDGVSVDDRCRTSLPDVYAIGDCALHRNAFAGGGAIRLESVQNANDQASVAANAISGGVEVYRATPWFWSHQYDLRLQTVGLSAGHDDLVVRGEPARRSFSVIYLRKGRVLALDCINSTKEYVQARALVIGGVRASPERLADATRPLAELMAGPAAPGDRHHPTGN